MAIVNTVLGPIDTKDLGFTLMHEHIMFSFPGMYRTFPELLGPDPLGRIVDDLKQAHALLGLFLSFQDIDWSRTRAFSPFGFGQIRINVRGQWSQGCVSEGSE